MKYDVRNKLSDLGISQADGITEQELEQLERVLGRKLPLDYREYLKLCGAEAVFPEVAEFNVPGYGAIDVESFHSVSDVVQDSQRYVDRIPQSVIPVASASGGDLVCVTTPDGPVVFWDHEREGDPSGIHEVASCFGQFVLKLGSLSAAPEISLDDVTVTLDPDLLKGR